MTCGKRIARGVGAVALAALLGAAPCRARGPAAWVLDGSDSDAYRLRLDRDIARSGDASMRLEARGNRRTRDRAVAVQMLDASAWRVRRVRLAGWLRTEDAGSGHLRMAGTGNEVLGGMYGRPMGMLPAPLNLDFEAGTDGF